ncbi:MAG TPA: SAM-dependent methyltransferase [Cryomorphaceae bacterium]|nr:SAM-dependent methyltransferase [Cryomorphaceae bacterium]
MIDPWYATWFNTEFYHDLYKHRDQYEARGFIEELCSNLKVIPGQTALDMACGKGRHAKVLSEQGLITVGIDLSEESIQYARRFEHKDLRFEKGNMLETLSVDSCDWIFNLFTSFGYFENDDMHQSAITNMSNSLRPGGKLVLDYMNSAKIALNLVPENSVQTELAHYSITRILEVDTIVKSIRIVKDCEIFNFEERVKAFSAVELSQLMVKAGLKVVGIKGDYYLSDYDPQSSDRMIIIAQKPIES